MEIRKTEIFVDWLENLKDRRAKARIIARIDRMEMGNSGSKKTQHADVAKAKELADILED